ncbi:cell division protein FtsX [Mangrovactinospora gilvigrisea]|uniref:Cell division protein FtsX n=1 Tax=Mangrovactinospora gilvigrisea TaxID=1428644 RepID=A0A1J7BG84_9ACTN|nr:permease-like cell division protein FtsX [Mangrovactinospora gilvigrisea]OIV37589.1 cell division protein FtsX [Mangrovactinospora gilvigrisea]
MRARFVFSEIGVGLRRNLTMTFAVVVSVALALALAGASLLVREQVSSMKGYWYDKVQVSIYLCNKGDQGCDSEVTAQQKAQIKSDLDKLAVVEKVYYESSAQAYDHYRQQFKDSPLLDQITPSQMQQSFRVKLKDPKQFAVIKDAFQGRPGVQSVQDQRDTLDALFRLLNAMTVAAMAVMAVMVVVAVLLIVNTVRVSAFSRRRETGIMRLVGASSFYIQMPFVLEAAIAGFIGSVLACGMIGAGQWLLIDKTLRPSVPLINFLGWGDIMKIFPLVIVFGVLMSAVSAFITLRKYLRV